jgi:hypothetical protein
MAAAPARAIGVCLPGSVNCRKSKQDMEKPSAPANSKLVSLLSYALFVFAVAYLIIYFWMAYYRLRYPFELEWIEGGIVDQVQRLIHAQSMYVAPGIDYVPFLYPPVYFYFSAAASLLFGGGFFPLRLVSFSASLVSFSVIFLIVYKETKNARVAIISTGVFAAAFRVTGAWLDIARVDSLFLAFWLLFIYFVRDTKSLRYSLLAGLFAALAYLTKQTALIACLPVLIFLFWRNWKFALASLAVAGLIVGLTTVVFNLASAGWYGYYVFGLLSQQTEWLPLEFVTFWKNDLLIHLPIASLFTLFFLLGRPGHDRRQLILWLSILTGALAGTFITRVKIGGYENVLLPTFAGISILFGLGLGGMLRTIKQISPEYRGRVEGYNPFAQIPTKSDLEAGNKLIQILSNVKGEVFLPDHGYLPELAGKKTYAHESAIWDVLRGNQQTQGKTLLAEDLKNAIRMQTFDEIILDSNLDFFWCCGQIDQYYTRIGDVFQDETSFYPVTGDKKRPTFVYIPRRLK